MMAGPWPLRSRCRPARPTRPRPLDRVCACVSVMFGLPRRPIPALRESAQCRRPSPTRTRRLLLEQVSQMIVQETPRRVHTAANLPEVLKARIKRRHVLGAVEMQLAPMRPRSVLPKDRVDVEKIAPIGNSRPTGDRDRHAGALVIRAEHP